MLFFTPDGANRGYVSLKYKSIRSCCFVPIAICSSYLGPVFCILRYRFHQSTLLLRRAFPCSIHSRVLACTLYRTSLLCLLFGDMPLKSHCNATIGSLSLGQRRGTSFAVR